MSGLTNDSTRKTYLHIIGGKVIMKVKSDTPGAVKRTNKNGDEVFELLFDSLEGRIKAIEVEDHKDYGQQLRTTVEANGEDYLLSMSMKSGYAQGLLYRLPNVDLDGDVVFKPYVFPQEGGKADKHVMVLYQSSEKVATAFTKDEPNGLPPMEQIKFDGKMRWDSTKRLEFLTDMVQGVAVLLSPQTQPVQAVEAVEAVEAVDEQTQELDDLGF